MHQVHGGCTFPWQRTLVCCPYRQYAVHINQINLGFGTLVVDTFGLVMYMCKPSKLIEAELQQNGRVFTMWGWVLTHNRTIFYCEDKHPFIINVH